MTLPRSSTLPVLRASCSSIRRRGTAPTMPACSMPSSGWGRALAWPSIAADAYWMARRGVAGVRIDFIGAGRAAFAEPALPRLPSRLAERDMVCAMQGEGEQWLAGGEDPAARGDRSLRPPHRLCRRRWAGVHRPVTPCRYRLCRTQAVGTDALLRDRPTLCGHRSVLHRRGAGVHAAGAHVGVRLAVPAQRPAPGLRTFAVAPRPRPAEARRPAHRARGDAGALVPLRARQRPPGPV